MWVISISWVSCDYRLVLSYRLSMDYFFDVLLAAAEELEMVVKGTRTRLGFYFY